jgi:hypothetical protein
VRFRLAKYLRLSRTPLAGETSTFHWLLDEKQYSSALFAAGNEYYAMFVKMALFSCNFGLSYTTFFAHWRSAFAD